MAFNYYLLIVFMLLVILLIRFLLLRRNSIPFRLFTQALRNENKGDFEAAIVNYETALEEVRKVRFSSSSLKNKIKEKLRTLKTVIDYQSNFHYLRV